MLPTKIFHSLNFKRKKKSCDKKNYEQIRLRSNKITRLQFSMGPSIKDVTFILRFLTPPSPLVTLFTSI